MCIRDRESRMPLCYGGGIKSVEQAVKIINLGVEKIAISSAVVNNPNLLKDISSIIGVQSVVVVLDYKKVGFFNKREIFINNGTVKTGLYLYDFISMLNKNDYVGELVINSIDNDGMSNGYDLKTIDEVRELFSGPLTVVGGAKDLNDIRELIFNHSLIGAGAGSAFVFKGKYKAVLILSLIHI